MKKSKKIVALLMALVMCLSFSTSVFASEVPDVEKHTITFEIPASDESGVQPWMWGQQAPSVNPGSARSNAFTITDRYFAYEMTATGASGNYAVSLVYENTNVTIASQSSSVDGVMHKLDWIDVTAGKSHQFIIYNYCSSPISVTLTYYSWP